MLLSELKSIDENIDLDEYLKLREDVKLHMEHPEWLGDFTREDLEKMLKNGSKIWLFYDNETPVCSMMLIPADEHSIESFNLEYDAKEVADYGPMFVDINYVGNGFQYQMLQLLDKYCIEHGYKYGAGTIHPDNAYSINNLVKDGFKLINTKEFKRGIRNIYIKEL